MEPEEIIGQRTDLAVRVVGGEQHLDEVTDPTLDQRHELLRLLPFGLLAQRIDDRCGVGGPARRRPVVQEPPSPQAAVDGLAEHLQPVAVVRSGEPHGAGDVVVLECRPYQQVGDVVGIEPGDHRRQRLVVRGTGHQRRTDARDDSDDVGGLPWSSAMGAAKPTPPLFLRAARARARSDTASGQRWRLGAVPQRLVGHGPILLARRCPAATRKAREPCSACSYIVYSVDVRTATLRDLNSNSSALARAAQAGETVVITDRGTPIADLIPHRGLPAGCSRDAFLEMVNQLRRLTLTSDTAEKQRAELDELVDPDVVDPYDRFR